MPPAGDSPTLTGELEPRQPPPVSLNPGLAEARSELSELARSLRAHLEQLQGSGAWGVPARAVAARLQPPEPSALAGVPGLAQPLSPDAPAAVRPPPEPDPRRVVTQVVSGSALARLDVLADEARHCSKCALHSSRGQSVFSRGTGACGLAFVGEGPGEEEDRLGQPFVGPAGQLLDRMIAAMQLDRDAVYVCNIVKCRPPKNRKPDLDEMSRCMPFLAEQLAIIKPRVIVALGATAVQGLLGTSEGITRLRGHWKLYRGNIPVMPTFHPAYLLRQPQAKREVWKDLQEVLRQLGTRKPAEPPE